MAGFNKIGATIAVGLDKKATEKDIKSGLEKIIREAGTQFDKNSLKIDINTDTQKVKVQLETLDGQIKKYVAKWQNDLKNGLTFDINEKGTTLKQFQNTQNSLTQFESKLKDIQKTYNSLSTSGKLKPEDAKKLSYEYSVLSEWIESAKNSQERMTASTKASISSQITEVNKLISSYSNYVNAEKAMDKKELSSTYSGIEKSLERQYQIQLRMNSAGNGEKAELQKELELINRKIQAYTEYKNTITGGSYNEQEAKLLERQLQLQNEYNIAVAKENDLRNKRDTQKYGDTVNISGISQTSSIAEVNNLISAQQKLNAEFVKQQIVYNSAGQACLQWTHKVNLGSGNVKQLTTTLNQATGQIRQNATVVRETSSAYDKLKNSSSSLIGVFKQFFGVYALFNQLRNGVKSVVEIDTAMTSLRKVTNETEATYRQFQTTASQMGTSLGRTTAEVIEATSAFARLGFTTKEAIGLAEKSLTMVNIGDGITQEGAEEAIVSTLKGFDMAGGTAEDTVANAQKVIDSINEVSNNYALSTIDLAEGIKRASATLNMSGTGFEETLGLLTGAIEVLQNAENASTGQLLKVV